MGYELSAERWSPVQSVEKILLSVVSMLAGNSVEIYLFHPHLIVSISSSVQNQTTRAEPMWTQRLCGARTGRSLIRLQIGSFGKLWDFPRRFCFDRFISTLQLFSSPSIPFGEDPGTGRAHKC